MAQGLKSGRKIEARSKIEAAVSISNDL